ncbi:MAG: enoyl-CoA hydratase-related protein [Chitinophagales bacterium]|nr:enoyl-CoA hydratase-related protein [Chitinophagales bacterium]MDW8419565.1 enoyl-CoA hydratase-related protein [Chitinophagales bacterium]
MIYTPEQTAQIHQHTFAHLLVHENEHLLTLTLNRPEKKNALNPTLFKELAFALSYAKHAHHVWVVVIKANGDVFCAGADLKAFAGATEQKTSTIPEPTSEIVLGDVFNALYKPCIARVHAPVYAGGFLIVCGCTHVIASENATFSLPEVKRGLFPFQVMKSLLGIMSAREALDFCIRAKTMTADEAASVGLVTIVTPPHQLDEEVENMVNDILQYSPTAIRMGLEAFHHLRNIPDAQAHKYLKEMLNRALQTEDAAEGIAAFAEKRKPNWKGR